ncbi:UNVERIFIED_CONTAM: hypothetical protein Sangu_2668400 [Sesamum angustifolium]|uniref:Reverse transcriptase domain-containing protein n=1 Tax=Sesamum angustifolium TaxID=2727405 RepID=A0AAW2J2L2_9LAMI
MIHTHENRGGTISSLGSIEDFNDMVLDSGLTDAGFEGEPFTWSNKRVWRRLDRVLYSQEWVELFNSTRVSHLPRRLSDQHPLLISATRTEDKVLSSFRFQHMWIMHPNFQEMIKQSWGAPIYGYGMYRLQQKLYRLKDHMKQWNRDIFGNVFSLVDQAKAAANEAEKQFDRLPSEANLINLNRQNAALVHALNLESEFWRQKSNCKWLEAGERNTKFFHSSVKKKRLKSRISKVIDNQQEITDSAQIKGSAVHFFGSILYDGFAAVTDFFSGTPMPRSFTATSIILIPKNDSPQSWSEFKPISLCNVTNKILSKLLYNKISQALPDLISPSQSGFVPGRLIANNILLAQEMTHHLDMRHSKGNLILKLDMSKAYDRVKWKFLYAILEKMGFPARFIPLIKHCIEHCWFTILVNGESSGFFKSSQGLRQGDPISPALFILASEALSRGLNHLFTQNPNMLYQTGCKTRVTHLAYADDIIIFTRYRGLGIRNIRETVIAFSHKLWWRLRQNNSLWASFTISKYCKKSTPAFAKGKQKDSNIWRRFCSIKSVSQENTFWSLGAGNVSFWYDCWLPTGTLHSLSHPNRASNALVKSFWTNHSWDIDKLKEVVPQHIMELILEIPINPQHQDVMHWKPSPHGSFSTKSAWEITRDHKPPLAIFKNLWSPLVRPTISIFIWKVLHNWISVDSGLKQKGILLASRCVLLFEG